MKTYINKKQIVKIEHDSVKGIINLFMSNSDKLTLTSLTNNEAEEVIKFLLIVEGQEIISIDI
jgi:hypothetical protein